MIEHLKKLVERSEARRAHDAERFAKLDRDRCQLCHAIGSDKRSLFIACGYAIHEVVPEVIDLFDIEPDAIRHGYYLRLCKTCRGELLNVMAKWRNDAIARRQLPKDHDGCVLDDDPERNIPVHVNGSIRMVTREEWERDFRYKDHRT